MPDITPKLGLKKPLENETVSRAAHNENLDLIDANTAAQSDFDAHKSAAVLDHPDGSVTTAKIATKAITAAKIADNTVGSGQLAAGAATDSVIGNRTISDVSAPTADTAVLTALMGWLANMIKSITGESSWRTVPGTTVKAIKSTLDAATSAPTPSTIAQRDSNGRIKAGAPSASDDVARKAEVDAARTDGTKPFKLEVRTSDPVNPEIGRIWIRSDL
ncbi:hypothetical protein [Paenibacillus sp. GYB003]|uniref:hypothetical protein n=1 Tax=Paenibacillus sp. GYB003 TaxID=2994392 RepID=UPI002F96B911